MCKEQGNTLGCHSNVPRPGKTWEGDVKASKEKKKFVGQVELNTLNNNRCDVRE